MRPSSIPSSPHLSVSPSPRKWPKSALFPDQAKGVTSISWCLCGSGRVSCTWNRHWAALRSIVMLMWVLWVYSMCCLGPSEAISKNVHQKNKDELVYICFSQDPIWPTSSCASTSTRPPTARKGLRRPKRFVSAAQPPELVLRASESRPTKGCTNMPETSKGRWGGEKMACGDIMSCLPVCFTRFHYNIHTQKLRVHVPELGPRVRLNHRTEHLRCQLQPLQL